MAGNPSKMDILDTLFGGSAKVKVMRLFLFNPDNYFDSKDIARRAKIDTTKARQTAQKLEKIGLVKKRTFYKEAKTKTRGATKKKVKGWTLDRNFAYLSPLQNMLVHIQPHKHRDIAEKFNNAGKIKLIIISGVFIQQWESRVDLLVVGDKLKRGVVESALRTLESEIGKELCYTVMETSQFQYRLSVFDKLVRDILDYPHEVVVDKIGINSPSAA